ITGQTTAFFSPDDVDGFLAAVRAAVPIPTTATAALEPPLSGVGGLIVFVGSVLAVLALAFVVFAFAYSPGPPDYTLTSTTLAILDSFYPVTLPAAEVNADHMQLVNIATDPSWKPVERTNGFANGHYHSGWFRVANGQKVRMYWAESTNLVLLPPKGNGSAVL